MSAETNNKYTLGKLAETQTSAMGCPKAPREANQGVHRSGQSSQRRAGWLGQAFLAVELCACQVDEPDLGGGGWLVMPPALHRTGMLPDLDAFGKLIFLAILTTYGLVLISNRTGIKSGFH